LLLFTDGKYNIIVLNITMFSTYLETVY